MNIDNEQIKQQSEQSSPEDRIRELELQLEQKDRRIDDKEAYVRKMQSTYDRKISDLMNGGTNNGGGSNRMNYNTPKTPPPDSSNFDDPDEYLSTRLKWELDNNINIKDLIREEVYKTRDIEDTTIRKKQFESNAMMLKKELPDFDEVAKSDIMLNIYRNSINKLPDILESMETGPQLAYYLGNNIDIASRLSELPPEKLVSELVKLHNKIDVKQKKTSSSSTKPISPVIGNSNAGFSKKTYEMTTEEWLAHKNKKG